MQGLVNLINDRVFNSSSCNLSDIEFVIISSISVSTLGLDTFQKNLESKMVQGGVVCIGGQ